MCQASKALGQGDLTTRRKLELSSLQTIERQGQLAIAPAKAQQRLRLKEKDPVVGPKPPTKRAPYAALFL